MAVSTDLIRASCQYRQCRNSL